jgi:hypothetical protein
MEDNLFLLSALRNVTEVFVRFDKVMKSPVYPVTTEGDQCSTNAYVGLTLPPLGYQISF